MTDNHGHAAWAPEQAIRERFSGPGCLIGAVNGRLIFDNTRRGPGHSAVFAGPGSDKTVTAVTRLWHWGGPRVVLDPSSQIGPIMSEALEADGYRVITIHPAYKDHNGTIVPGKGLNVLDWIDITEPAADAHIRSVVELIYNEGDSGNTSAKKDPFWALWGKTLITALLADMLYAKTSEAKTLSVLRDGLSKTEEEMRKILAHIHENSESRMARRFSAGLVEMKADQTFSSVYANAFAATEWLDTYGDVVSGSEMDTSDILDPRTVVFVQIDLRTLIATPAVARATMGALFNAAFHADGNIPARILFELDEVAQLGRLKEIMLAHVTGRKYKIAVQSIWQSEGQIEAIWGKDDAKVLRDCLAWRSYSAIQDGDIAEKLSRDIGHHAVMAHSEGQNQGSQRPWLSFIPGSRNQGSNVNTHEIRRRLITADEILRSPANRMIVLARDFAWPIDAVSAPYFQQEDIKYRVNADRFVTAAE